MELHEVYQGYNILVGSKEPQVKVKENALLISC